MVAPKAITILSFGETPHILGIYLACPNDDAPLRCETPDDYTYPVPDLVGNAGPLGFIARCDKCGFRVEMKGNRLPTVRMMEGL